MKIITKSSKILCFLFLIISLASCEKINDVNPNSSDYDIANSVFRVHVTTESNVPYHVSITRGISNTATDDLIDVDQNSGDEFNFGFTPSIGNTITVTVESTKAVNCYVFYKGSTISKVDMKKVSEGNYSGELSYSVTK